MIPAVLHILGEREVSPREPAAIAAEPFSKFMTPGGTVGEKLTSESVVVPDNRRAPAGREPLPPLGGATFIPVEQRSYDSFLRALEDSKQPIKAHALDLFR